MTQKDTSKNIYKTDKFTYFGYDNSVKENYESNNN